jgi:hypothetical protein
VVFVFSRTLKGFFEVLEDPLKLFGDFFGDAFDKESLIGGLYFLLFVGGHNNIDLNE